MAMSAGLTPIHCKAVIHGGIHRRGSVSSSQWQTHSKRHCMWCGRKFCSAALTETNLPPLSLAFPFPLKYHNYSEKRIKKTWIEEEKKNGVPRRERKEKQWKKTEWKAAKEKRKERKKKDREREGRQKKIQSERSIKQGEKSIAKKKKGKKHKALKDRNISVEINSKKKMRGAAYWKGKGLFGIGQNGFEKLMITIEIVQMLKTGLFSFALN